MKNKSIMFWVVVTLLLIGALPFLLSWYQIQQSREAVVDQAQKNHLIISRATADRVTAVIEKYQDVSKNLANNPDVYLAPDSEAAVEAIKTGLILYDEIKLIGLVLERDDAGPQFIQLARKDPVYEVTEDLLDGSSQKHTALIAVQGERLLLLKTPSARPFVSVVMLLKLEFDEWLNPRELGQAASLSLVDQQGQLMAHAGDPFIPISADWLTLMASGSASGSANRTGDQAMDQFIAAFAQVTGLPWYIVSRQSVMFAEQATATMRTNAWRIFSLVMITMLGLMVMAYFSLVKPIRRIVNAQKALVGGQVQDEHWHGGEVQALEESFDALTKHINDRNALGKVFVDRYQVISPIGKGGMGTVFLGWDPKLDRHVALKTLPIGNQFDSRENMSDTLVQEAITAARISHRNVVAIYDVVSTKTTAFIAMEYIKGESLHQLLDRQGCLNLSHTLSIAIAVLRGLQTAHKLGFVHRDIKPANILLDVNGDIKLTDFGTATLVQGMAADSITGTHGYMAPETYLNGEVSVQSDLFAVGVLIAECLLGTNPFKRKKVHQTRSQVINHPIQFPARYQESNYVQLFKVIEMMLHKDPNMRPQNAMAAAELITQHASCPIQWDPEQVGVRVQKSENRNEDEDTVIMHS